MKPQTVFWLDNLIGNVAKVVSIGLAIAGLLLAAEAFAQAQTVNQGAPGAFGPWPVRFQALADGGPSNSVYILTPNNAPLPVTMTGSDGGTSGGMGGSITIANTPLAVTGPDGGPVMMTLAGDGGAFLVTFGSAMFPVMAQDGGTSIDVHVMNSALPITTADGGPLLVGFGDAGPLTITFASGQILPVALTDAGTVTVVPSGDAMPVSITGQPINVAVIDAGIISVLPTGGPFPVTAAGGSFAVTPGGGTFTVAPSGTSLPVNLTGQPISVNASGGSFAVTPGGGVFSVTPSGGTLPVSVTGQPLSVTQAGTVTVSPAGGAMPVSVTGAPLPVTIAGQPIAVVSRDGGPMPVVGADGGPVNVMIVGNLSNPDGGPLSVTIAGGFDAGALYLSCAAPAQQNAIIGTTASPCPPTRTPGTNWMQLCNDRSSATNTTLKVRFDGVAPSTSPTSPGLVLAPGDCYSDYFPATVVPSCLGSAAGVVATTLECTRL